MDAFGRICLVVSDLSGFERKLVRWCRICPVVSDWYVGFSVGFSEWQSSRGGSCRPDVGLQPSTNDSARLVPDWYRSHDELGSATTHWRLTT